MKKLQQTDEERRTDIASLIREFGELAPQRRAEVTTMLTELRDRIFAYLANHPDGTKLVEMEEEFGIEIPDEDAEKMTTVGSAIKYIEDKIGNK